MNPKIRFVGSRRVPPGRSPGVQGFVRWIREQHPTAYAQLQWKHPQLLHQAQQLDGLGDVAPVNQPSALERAAAIAQQIASVVQPFLQLSAQKKLLKVQTQRAAQGLPPLDVSQLALPATRVQIDAGPQISSAIKWPMIGLGVAAGIALYMLLKKR